MAVIKVACPKCGQKVSGDETFIGSEVECPICSSAIRFPGEMAAYSGAALPKPEPKKEAPPSTNVPVPHEKSKGYDDTSEVGHDVVQRKENDDEDIGDAGDIEEKDTGRSRERRRKRKKSRDEDSEYDDDFDDLPPSPIFGAISIVSAVLTVVSCFTLGIIFAPVAIISGHTALAKARHSPVQPAPGHTLGAIGLMIGYIGLAITIILLAVAAFFGENIRDYFQAAE